MSRDNFLSSARFHAQCVQCNAISSEMLQLTIAQNRLDVNRQLAAVETLKRLKFNPFNKM